MKYLILAPDDHRIIHISDDLGYQSNGNYLINHGTLAVPPTICQMVEVEAVPAEVEPEKWLYVDGGFAVNPNWRPPTPEPELTDALAALHEIGVDTTPPQSE